MRWGDPKTDILNEMSPEQGFIRRRPHYVQPRPSHGLPRLCFAGAYVRIALKARVSLNSPNF
jgi:hypothetical protein